MSKSFAVLGMGRFGRHLAQSLCESGAAVMIADQNEEVIRQFSETVTAAMLAELRDPDAVKALGLEDVDVVVVAMGESLEASIMCVITAKEVGVPLVIAKASNRRMGDILTRVGADRIIYPEEETAFRTARKLLTEDFLEYFDLSDDLCLINMRPKPDWIGKNLRTLALRGRYDINVVAIREGEKVLSRVDPDKPLSADATLLIVVDKKNLKKLGRI